MGISQKAWEMANAVMEQLMPSMKEVDADQDETDETRMYYENLAQIFLDAIPIYKQGVNQYVNYEEQAIQAMADSIFAYVRSRYVPNIQMSTNEIAETKKFYSFLARGFLEGINAPTPTAGDMADRMCAHAKAYYSPNVKSNDKKMRDDHFVIAEGFLNGMAIADAKAEAETWA